MKKLLLALALAFPSVPAYAETFSCTSTSIVGNSYNLSCTRTDVTPTPIDPPPPPPPTPTPTGCVSTGYQLMNTLGNANASSLHWGVSGTVYTYPLPKGPNGHYGTGFLQQGDHPQTPTEMTVEWAISRCPGDMNYYKNVAAAIAGRGGVIAYPCGGVNGAVGGSYYWSLEGSSYQCKVDNNGPWYINVRYVNGCYNNDQGCPVSYFFSVQ